MTKNKNIGTISISRRAALTVAASAAALIAFAAPAPSFAEDKSIKVGIMSGEDEDVWRVVVAKAAEKGLTIEKEHLTIGPRPLAAAAGKSGTTRF